MPNESKSNNTRKGVSFGTSKMTTPSLDNLLEFSRPRSASLNNLEQFKRSPSVSPKAQRSLLTSSPFKGLRKKLHALKSKSNCDILDQLHNENKNSDPSHNNANRLFPRSNHHAISIDSNRSPKDTRKLGVKDEMKKKKGSVDNNNAGGPINYEQHSSALPNATNNDKTMTTSAAAATTSSATSQIFDINTINSPRHRIRMSQDSTDQFIVVDNVHNYMEYEDNYSASENDEIDGFQPSEEHTDREIERLMQKIERTRSELVRMQLAKDENVKEYLKSADSTSESAATTKTKMNFEKNNLRTNTSIQLLQKKLEKYQLQLKVLEERGIHGPKRIIRAVQDHVRSGASTITEAVSKPLGSFNNFIKKDKKEASSDNVYITVTQNDDGSTCSMNNISDEDSVCSNQLSSSGHHGLDTDTGTDNENASPRHLLAVQNEKIEQLTKENEELRDCVHKLRDELSHVLRSVQEEHYKSEQLQNEVSEMYNQWNDLTELHQNEMTGLKHEVDQTLERIECTEYRFSERSGEVEELIGGCVTRITKMELQQQHQQQILLSVDGYFDGSGNARMLLSKLLSLVVSMFAILLVVISMISRIVMPFTSNRARVLSTCIVFICIILVWKNSENGLFIIFDIISRLVQPIYNRLYTRPSPSTDTPSAAER